MFKHWKKIVKFYKRIAGEDVGIRIQTEIVNATVKLEDHPKIGRIDPLLTFKNLGHRYLISGHCKIFYDIIDDDILITDVFDKRQAPNKIKKDI
ncbi:type II toxin-antitoxin system RelE/ParE family toxin [Marivirga harenae]|uniref:type II toxin-antitoxin system RelE/ParE family toxin n=1 Tax=Marivirga harenae TaxID=2010992 RepID=UPI00349ED103